ncbi:holin [Pseudomonas phage phCDa]|uniref:Uncharacterized protein n=1 Tax=Pseudomonas phage phCDa TaxID=2268587 RepID=A0A2Z5H9A5_9CAUD|nr:holin [Pseudomonas phage phCDa]AXC36529.1 hypothetical protein phCDa_85 [Pseudomonas phage phCDa]
MFLSSQIATIMSYGHLEAFFDWSVTMPWKDDPALTGWILALVISLGTGILSVAQALAGGQKFSIFWLIAQMLGAVIAGWLVWDMYPAIAVNDGVPAWLTQPIATSIAAHLGGKLFNIVEFVLGKRIGYTPTN